MEVLPPAATKDNVGIARAPACRQSLVPLRDVSQLPVISLQGASPRAFRQVELNGDRICNAGGAALLKYSCRSCPTVADSPRVKVGDGRVLLGISATWVAVEVRSIQVSVGASFEA